MIDERAEINWPTRPSGETINSFNSDEPKFRGKNENCPFM